MKKIKTESVCNKCLKTIPAIKYEKDGSVFIEKECHEHGVFVSKIAKDPKRFFDKTFSSETKYIAIKYTTTSSYTYLYLDDFVFEQYSMLKSLNRLRFEILCLRDWTNYMVL